MTVKHHAGSYTVRPARSEDLLPVLRVLAHYDAGSPLPAAASEVEEQTWERMMATDDLTVYVAEVDGQLIGTATLLTMPNLTYDCAPTAFVEAVVVTAGHRQKGIATAMMRRILGDARAVGCDKVQVLSHKRHATDGAHRLYAALGFEPEAEGFRLYLKRDAEAV